MKKYWLSLFIIIIFFSYTCKQKYFSTRINEAFIEAISKDDKNLPSRFLNIIFFCKCENNKILALDVRELREIYLREEHNQNYHDFLFELLNQERIITCSSNNSKTFEINKDIESQYKSHDINEFISNYFIQRNVNVFRLKKDITKDKRETIFYFLFLSNYLTSFDDYSGSFVIYKNSLLFSPTK